jgi:tartrate-resistant acid phosphatase type 5
MARRTPKLQRTQRHRAIALLLVALACNSRDLASPTSEGAAAQAGRNDNDPPPSASNVAPWVKPGDPRALVGRALVPEPPRAIQGLEGNGGNPTGGASGGGSPPISGGTGGTGDTPAAGGTTGGGAGSTSHPTAGAGASGTGGLTPVVDTDLGEGPVTRFAVIGDYGVATTAEAEVARLVRGFDPEFVVTTGDNNYPSGSAATIDANIGQFYHSFIYPYRGKYGDGATENRFFPTLGNHDWYTPNAEPYLDYFELPGNERYYDVVRGNVHYFAIDSDVNEPDGTTSTSVQGQWCAATARASTAPFRVAAMHHPPYSSGSHGNTSSMQWPYREWGFDLVLAGHDHTYERIELGGVTYVVNGLGGNFTYGFGTPVPGSVARDNLKQGALFVEASATKLVGRFVDIDGRLADVFALERR